MIRVAVSEELIGNKVAVSEELIGYSSCFFRGTDRLYELVFHESLN